MIVRNHLIPAFGSLQLADLTVEGIERHLVALRKKGLSPATRNRQLNVLSLIVRSALRQRKMTENPVPLVERPKERLRKWRIFSPAEVGRIERAFDDLIAEAETDRDRADIRVVRLMFLTMMGTAIRRGELLGLRWRAVFLADPDGPKIRIEETWVRSGVDTPKSAAGQRTIALGKRLAEELTVHLGRSPFSGDDERVFVNPRTGHPFADSRYKAILTLAFAKAKIEGEKIRPAHDLRHSSITNSAAAGTKPEALMSRAGHSFVLDDTAVHRPRGRAVPRRRRPARRSALGRVRYQIPVPSCRILAGRDNGRGDRVARNTVRLHGFRTSRERRGEDLNLRSACTDNGFRDRRIRPLCHPSGVAFSLASPKHAVHVEPAPSRMGARFDRADDRAGRGVSCRDQRSRQPMG